MGHNPENEFECATANARPRGLVREFWDFLTTSKKWWLLPVFFGFAVIGALALLSSTGLAPFIYSLF